MIVSKTFDTSSQIYYFSFLQSRQSVSYSLTDKDDYVARYLSETEKEETTWYT